MQLDLHIHTTASDGQYSPEAIVEMSYELGLHVIAITDHDTVSGIRAGKKKAAEINMKFISGIEISTQRSEEVHILGLNINEENNELKECCAQYENERTERGKRICEFFQRRDIPMNLAEVEVLAGGGSLGRPHFARWLQEHGYVAERKEAFIKYLDTEEFHMETDRTYPSPEFAIGLIHRAGGKAVLAHPGLLKMSYEEQKKMVSELKSAGLDGIECFYSKHSDEQTEMYLNIARKNDLKISCGSDYHGEKVKTTVGLGMILKEQYIPDLIL